MKKFKYTSENPYQQEIDIYLWCKEVTRLYYRGELDQKQIDILNESNFPWEHYKEQE